jgi:hypothetical protein
MRLPIKEKGSRFKKLNDIYLKMENLYLQALMQSTEKRDVKVMLADATVIDSKTFDPNHVRMYFKSVIKNLPHWTISDIRESQNDDVCRSFLELSKDISKFRLKGYLGIQYRVLSYYRVDKQVIAIQKELRELTEKEFQLDKAISEMGNRLIKDQIEEMGLKDLSQEALLDRFLSDPSLIEELEKKATYIERIFPEVRLFEDNQTGLKNKLKNLILEMYEVSQSLIDHNQLMQGELGFVMYFDILLPKSSNTQASYEDIDNLDRLEFLRITDSFSEILVSLECSKSDKYT